MILSKRELNEMCQIIKKETLEAEKKNKEAKTYLSMVYNLKDGTRKIIIDKLEI